MNWIKPILNVLTKGVNDRHFLTMVNRELKQLSLGLPEGQGVKIIAAHGRGYYLAIVQFK